MADIEKIDINKGGWVWRPASVEKQGTSIKKKDIKKTAIADANNSIPKIKESELSGMQRTIADNYLNAVENNGTRFNGEKIDCLSHLNNKLKVEPVTDTEDEIVNNLDSLVRARIDDFKTDMVDLASKEVKSRKALASFKAQNELDNKTGWYPDNIYLPVSILVVAFAVETFVNGLLFKEVMPGWIGGIVQAAGFSVINMGFALILGLVGLRLSQHIKPSLKIFGILLSVLCVFLGLFWNGYVAHFREIAATGSLDLSGAFLSLVNHPFRLDSSDAFILFFLGIMIFFGVAYEGLNAFSDKYWGFGKTQKDYDFSKLDFQDLQLEIKEAAQDTIEDSIVKIKQEMEEERAKEASAVESVNNIIKQRANENNSAAILIAEANDLLDYYRGINSNIRSGARPASFNIKLKLEDAMDKNLFSIEDLEKKVEDIKSQRKKNIKSHNKLISALNKHSSKISDQISTIFASALAEAEKNIFGEETDHSDDASPADLEAAQS